MRARMQTVFGQKRLVVLAIGALDCFVSGTSYLYAVFQPYIMEYFGADSAMASAPFTLMWSFMTLAMFFVAPMQRALGAKMTVAIGLGFMGLACLGCSFLPPDMLFAMPLCYSAFFGIGLGVCFNGVASAVLRWFPDRKGFASAFTAGMIGAPGIVLPPLFAWVLARFGLQLAFRLQALLFVPCIALTLIVFEDAPRGFMAQYVPEGRVAKETSAHECLNLRDLISSRDAWMIVVLFFAFVTVYVTLSPAVVSYGTSSKGLDALEAVWYVSAASLVQVIGRFLFPGVSDRLGRKRVFLVAFGLMAAAIAFITLGEGALYALGFCMLAFAYGGGVALLPPIVADRLGSRNAAQNIAFAELGTLAASFASILLVNALPMEAAILVAGAGGCVLGVAAILAIFGGRQGEYPPSYRQR